MNDDIAELARHWRRQAAFLREFADTDGADGNYAAAVRQRYKADTFDACAAQLEVVLAKHAQPGETPT